MAEIFRVLFVTLLINVYWPPSVCKFISGGDLERMLKDFPPGWRQIVLLIMAYTSDGCGAAQAGTYSEVLPVQLRPTRDVLRSLQKKVGLGNYVPSIRSRTTGAETRPDYTPGQVHIIKLLSSFYSRDCKVGDYVNDIPDSDFSAGEKQIFRMLSAFTSSGCSAAAKASFPPETPTDPQFTAQEAVIINVLSKHFLNECKNPDGDTNRAFGDDSTIRPRNAAHVNVQSVVLQLFLSIIGVCLTRIELLAH